jgi:hypothetical protein
VSAKWVSALVFAASVLSSSSASAGPWTRDVGHAYVKLGSNLFLADEFVDINNQVQQGASFFGATTSVYGEVGIWKKLHLQFFLPHAVFRNTYDSGDQYLSAGGGDARVALQWTSPLEIFAHAIRLEMKVPLYDAADPEDVPPAVRAQFPLRGDGQLDVTLWLSAGGGLPGIPIYIYGEIGHQFRTEAFIGTGLNRAFSDTFVYVAEVGWTFYRQMVLAAFSQGFIPYQSDEFTRAFVDVNAKIYAPVWKGLALEANVGFIPWARAASKGLSVGFGVSYNL